MMGESEYERNGFFRPGRSGQNRDLEFVEKGEAVRGGDCGKLQSVAGHDLLPLKHPQTSGPDQRKQIQELHLLRIEPVRFRGDDSLAEKF